MTKLGLVEPVSAADAHTADGGRNNNAETVIQASWLGPTVVLRGELSFEEPLVVRGQIHGRATGTAAVFFKKSARISGEFSAVSIELEKGVPLDRVTMTGLIRRTRAR